MHSAADTASSLREHFASPSEALDVAAVARSLGCKVSRSQRQHGSLVEASLRPSPRSDRFHITVDPTPRRGWGATPHSDREAIGRQRYRFRVCHELAHTFYFSRAPGRGPKRRQPWSAVEEDWCDEFSRSLLIPAQVSRVCQPTAESAVELQARFDVSLEVAARALSAAHPRIELGIWYWPVCEPPHPSSLLRQWTTLEKKGALRIWRMSDLVQKALDTGRAEGTLPVPQRRNTVSASAVALYERQQLLVTGH